MTTNKNRLGVSFIVATLCVAFCFTVRWPLLAQDSDSTRSKLSALLEERREVLKARVEIFENLVGIARSSPEALIAARDDLLDAEYELAASSSQRTGVLQRKLKNAKQLELVMEERKRNALGTETEVLMAKADRLGVEIELLRETEAQEKSQ